MSTPSTIIEIRKMSTADIPAVGKIHSEVLDETYISYGELHLGLASTPTVVSADAPRIFHDELHNSLNNESVSCFVAESNGQIIGFAISALRNAIGDSSECWLEDIGVDPNFREEGVGEKLAKAVFNWAQEKHATYVLAEINVKNKLAQKGAMKMGFNPFCTIFLKSV